VTLGFGPEIVPIELSSYQGVDALYAPRRTVLDQALLRAATDADAELQVRAALIGLTRDRNGRVDGVRLRGHGAEREVSARIVIGADGVKSKMASLVGADAYRYHPVSNSVYYAYHEGVETDGVYFQFTPGATAGLIPTNDGQVCVYVGWPSEQLDTFRADPDTAFRRQLGMAHPELADRVSAGVRVSQFRGTTGLPGFLRQPVGPGWALVGDAGYTKDPVSAHGISDGLRDAELCARAVDAALSEPTGEMESLYGYQQARDRLSTAMLEISSELASYTWDAGRASELMRGLSNEVKTGCDAMVALGPWPGALRDLATAV
jgi:flavin-dependent dehydrogenase